MFVSVGIQIRHTAITNHIGLVKKSMSFVMRKKLLIFKRFKNDLPIFVFIFRLNGGLNDSISCFLFLFVSFMLALLLSLLG